MGGYACTCGCPDCICDPGETPVECPQRLNRIPELNGGSLNQAGSPINKAPASDFDFGSGAMLLALAFLIWTRLRT